jgi:apolipoprotein D and lipocalin family protein
MMITGCSTSGQIPETVPQVDLQKYAGKWFEIASFPASFQKNCFCSMAEYTATDKGYVKVFNTCRKGGLNGKRSSISGKAFPVAGSGNSKLRVQFFWPFRADYWIVGLADDYSFAMVSEPSRKYLWILCRKPQMDETTYQSILGALRDNGFELSRLKQTDQGCE